MRLADPLLRAPLFDQESLGQLLRAGYESEAMALEGPFSASFETFHLGVSIPQRTVLDGTWGKVGGSEHSEGRFTAYGIGSEVAVRVDALWRGAITARTVSATARVEQVVSRWPDPGGIDAEIIAALGSLPTDATRLERERRTRFIARLRAGLSQPAVLTDARFDEWLAELGAGSVGQLMSDFRNQLLTGSLTLRFSMAPPAPAAQRALPVSAAVLIRDEPLQVAQLLAESKRIRERLEQFGLDRPRDASSPEREALLVIWMIPDSTFDDADWPGAEGVAQPTERRRRRRAVAGQWLAREGIGLVPTPAHK